ncbi:glutathione S-transferase family protein [Paracraurococcus ruber]|uniref:glutathione S-transferase family protein n=1 Tax=Paracraurococcus ruber TaxID=77675 RepID=UPI0013052727|nr:glutathione S-transferase family protein [Paracraurococcus ruber]
MAELEILGIPQSNFVWACRLAAAEKGVPHSLLPLMPHAPEVKAINPTGKVPAMRHGAVTLGESRAICGYIDAAFDGPRLIPADTAKAALVEQWASIVNTVVEPVCVRQYLMGYFFPGTPDGSPNRAVIDPAIPKMQDQLRMLDQAVAATGFLAGDAFSLADVFLVPNLVYLSRAPESGALLKELPALSAYLDRMLSRPTVQATIPPPIPT